VTVNNVNTEHRQPPLPPLYPPESVPTQIRQAPSTQCRQPSPTHNRQPSSITQSRQPQRPQKPRLPSFIIEAEKNKFNNSFNNQRQLEGTSG